MTIERTVITCFIHEAKKKNYYVHFLTNLKNNNMILDAMSNRPIRRRAERRRLDEVGGTSLNNCKSIEDLENTLISLNGGKKTPKSEEETVRIITMSINHLLHYFLEQYLSIKELCVFGQGVFDEAMKRLSISQDKGNDSIENISDVPSLINMLRHKYFLEGKEGKSFQEYIEENNDLIKRWTILHPSEEDTQRKISFLSSRIDNPIEELVEETEDDEDEEEEAENGFGDWHDLGDLNDLFNLN